MKCILCGGIALIVASGVDYPRNECAIVGGEYICRNNNIDKMSDVSIVISITCGDRKIAQVTGAFSEDMNDTSPAFKKQRFSDQMDSLSRVISRHVSEKII